MAEGGPPGVAPLERRVSQEAINRYAEATGDFNPIHVDEDYARRTPFGGTIAHGMLVLAYLSEAMTAAFGRSWWEGGRLKVRFKGPARPGDTLTVSVRPNRAGERWEYAVAVTCGDETVVSGTAEVPASAGGGQTAARTGGSDHGGD